MSVGIVIAPPSGAADAIAAFCTVAWPFTRSSTSCENCRRLSRLCAVKSGACRLSTLARSNPGSTAYSCISVRVRSPAPISSMNDAASWLTTSRRCARRRPRRAGDASARAGHGARRIVDEREPRRPRKQHRDRDRDDHREAEHPAIDGDLAGAIGEAAGVRDQQIESAHREHEPERRRRAPTARGSPRAVAGAAAAAGAPSAARIDISVSRLHQPRQRQVADVRARDDQHERSS